MTKEHLTKLWKWLSLACLAYVVGSVISMQGGVDVFSAKLFADVKKDGPPVIAYFSAIVGGGVLSLALVVAVVYARRHGDAWHSRTPVVFLEGLDTGTREGQIFQALVIVVLVLLPLIGIGRSVIVANEGVVCEQTEVGAAPKFYGSDNWKLIDLPSHKDQLRLMKHDTKPGDCGGSGVEIGWYTPWAFAGLPALAVLLSIAWAILLARPPEKNKDADPMGQGEAKEA